MTKTKTIFATAALALAALSIAGASQARESDVCHGRELNIHGECDGANLWITGGVIGDGKFAQTNRDRGNVNDG